MSKRSYMALLPPVLFAAMLVIFLFAMQRENPNALPSVLEGKPAPALTLSPMAQYPELTLETLQQPGVKLVNFWASWCGPCRTEHPILEQLAREGIPIYGVNYKDRLDDALAFLQELGNPYQRMGADITGRTAIDWGVYGVPETFVVDGNGQIILRLPGALSPTSLDKRLRPVLKKIQDQPIK